MVEADHNYEWGAGMTFETVTIGPCTLYRADCRELVASGRFAACESIITDPPYGISHGCNFRSRGRSKLANCNEYADVIGDDKPFDPAFLIDMGKPLVLWGGNYFVSRLEDSSGWLVWDKLRPDTLDQSTCELAWTNCVKGCRRFAHLWHGMMRDSEKGENHHPMQKPVALAKWILSLPWIPAGRVGDPYMGAGWVGVASVLAGREFTGAEITTEYFDIACRRIERAWADRCNRLPFDQPEPMKQRDLLETV